MPLALKLNAVAHLGQDQVDPWIQYLDRATAPVMLIASAVIRIAYENNDSDGSILFQERRHCGKKERRLLGQFPLPNSPLHTEDHRVDLDQDWFL